MPVKETGRAEKLVSQRQRWQRRRPRASAEEEDLRLISSQLTSSRARWCLGARPEQVAAASPSRRVDAAEPHPQPCRSFPARFPHIQTFLLLLGHFFKEASSGTRELLPQST